MGRILAYGGQRLLEGSNRLRAWVAPIDVHRKSEAMASLISELKPDLVHAMRLPFEGFLAASAVRSAPLLLSIWGNDYTLFADRSRRLGRLTDEALDRADGLHCDCRRDLEASLARGFSQAKPWRVLPGNGGVQTEQYLSLEPNPALLRELGIPVGVPLVVNPRGFRAYVRNDIFFRAIPQVLREIPEAFFVGVGMAGNPVAERWMKHNRAARSVRLLPTVERRQLAALFASSLISVSPSSHDGTPNTLLEAMACGCLPVVGDITSLHEWLENGKNGIICDHTDANALADAILRGLRDERLRTAAAEINRQLIRERADYSTVMQDVEQFYGEVAATKKAAAANRS